MGPTTLAPLAFIGLLSIAGAVLLFWNARRIRATDLLRRRLGERRGAGDPLVKDEVTGGFAQLIAESGLSWTAGQLATRAALAAGVGMLVGLGLGSGALGFVLALAGCAAMWIIVRQARARRLALCDQQMPQALEIMALALRAGHALPGALLLAAQESPSPLCLELQRACDEHELGRPIAEVLAAMGERLPGCAAVETFVVAVGVLQETGGNMISVIDRIVENARARAGYKTRLRALTAEGRQSARLLGALPAGFFVIAIMSDKSYANTLLHDRGGNMILFVTTVLWVAGLLWTRRLVRPLA